MLFTSFSKDRGSEEVNEKNNIEEAGEDDDDDDDIDSSFQIFLLLY